MSVEVLGSAAVAFLLGLLGGGLFAGALWLSVNATVRARRPGIWLAVGLALRLGAAFALLYLAARLGGWQALLAATAGFLVARTVAVGLARRRATCSTDAT